MSAPGPPELAGDRERAPCALCGGAAAAPLLRAANPRRRWAEEFSLVRCPGCGLVRVDPRPTRAALAGYYPEGYAPRRPGPPSLPERVYYRLFRRPPAPPGGRVLDVGCGGGKYLAFLRDRGYRVAGVEADRELAGHLRRAFGFEVHAGRLPELDLEPESFDAVTLWWVLEHTHDPLEVLRGARRVLRPGGGIAVGVQNFASLGRLVFGGRWHHLDLPLHLFQFEPRTLREILRRSGFEAVRLRQDPVAKDFAPSLGYALGRRASLDRPLPNLLALPFDLLAWSLRRSGLITAYARRP